MRWISLTRDGLVSYIRNYPNEVIHRMDSHSGGPLCVEVRKNLLGKVEILCDVLLVMVTKFYKSPLGISYP